MTLHMHPDVFETIKEHVRHAGWSTTGETFTLAARLALHPHRGGRRGRRVREPLHAFPGHLCGEQEALRNLRQELIDVAAVAVAAVECIDRAMGADDGREAPEVPCGACRPLNVDGTLPTADPRCLRCDGTGWL